MFIFLSFFLFFLCHFKESVAQSASSEENTASEVTMKIGMELTLVQVNLWSFTQSHFVFLLFGVIMLSVAPLSSTGERTQIQG